MANVCSNYMNLTGEEEDLLSLEEAIQAQDKDLLELFPFADEKGAYNIWDHRREGDTYVIGFQSPWRCPFESIDKLCREFHLNAEVWYEEQGMATYGFYQYIFGRGCGTKTDIMEEFFESQYPEYAACKRDILEEPYESFLKTYKDGFPYEEVEGADPRFACLERHIVKRIKDEDLPLFCNTKWEDEEAKNLYVTRFNPKQ